jgi:hypothetical protein
MPTARSWNDMLDVKGSSLQGLMHTAVRTPPCGSGFDCRSLTDSTHSIGAATVIPIANPPGKVAYV